MIGKLAHLLALVAHARARRIDPTLGGDAAYWKGHSTTRHVSSVQFCPDGVIHVLFPDDLFGLETAEWLASIPSTADVVAVRLESRKIYFPESSFSSHVMSSPSEGILISGLLGSLMWTSHWSSAENRGESKARAVVYSATSVPNRSIDNPSIDLASELLDEALREIREFAAEEELSFWCDRFDAARDALRADHPVLPFYPDILPPRGFTLEARRLLAGAMTGYVFSGADSWKDLDFRDEESVVRHSMLTEWLRRTVAQGVIAAVNRGDEASAH